MYNRSDMMHDQKGVVYECIEADIRPGDNWPSWQALAIPSVFTMLYQDREFRAHFENAGALTPAVMRGFYLRLQELLPMYVSAQ